MHTNQMTVNIDPAYLTKHVNFSNSHRAIVVSWLTEVHEELFGFTSDYMDVLCLTVSLMDRYFSVATCPKNEVQLYSTCALWLAYKWEVEEPHEDNITATKLATFTGGAYTARQILVAEKIMFQMLKCQVNVPTVMHYWVQIEMRFISQSSVNVPGMFFLAAYRLLGVSLHIYDMLIYPTEEIALACAWLAAEEVNIVDDVDITLLGGTKPSACCHLLQTAASSADTGCEVWLSICNQQLHPPSKKQRI